MGDCQIAKHALKVAIAQICQNIGWHAVQSSPMDILIDVLQRYITEISKSAHQYSSQYNRTEPNLDDLDLTFKDFGIGLQEFREYINNVEPVEPPYKIGSFPVANPPKLQHPNEESREILSRPEHIPEYLPLMHPDLEEDGLFPQQSTADGHKKNSLETSGDDHSPQSSPKHGSRRNNEWPLEPNKKSRYYTEEDGRPMREVTSVFLTPTGFISPVHEGKSAEASIPCLVDSPPPTPELPSHSVKESKGKESKKDKSKSKKDKEISKKDVKKLKSKKENKENAAGKHEKSVSSSTSKKDHSSSHKSTKLDKSMKSDDSVRQKSKSDKMKLKAQKEEIRKVKDGFKLSKMKSKLKHSGGSGSSHIKSAKLSSSKKLKASKMDKSIKHLKGDRIKSMDLPPDLPPPPAPMPPKEVVYEHKLPVVESKIEKEFSDEPMDYEDLDFREDSPEPCLVIDDSLETQARQEKESRLEVIDSCIDAVIRRGEEESEVENKAMDDTISSVARGPGMRRLEAKDIYDFTDTSDSSSLSSCDLAPSPKQASSSKKEKKAAADSGKNSDSPKRSRKDKQKKKNKESKTKASTSPYSSPKSHKSSNYHFNDEERMPSSVLKDDLLSSDGSTPSSSPRSNSYFDHSPEPPSHHQPPLLSHVPPPPPFTPGSSYSSSPFAPIHSLPGQTTSHFPTPPLFVNTSKSEGGSSFQGLQPLNLAKSSPSGHKSSPESHVGQSSAKSENSDIIKKASTLMEKAVKTKDRKKEKIKKKGKKETEKLKEKKEKEELKEKEKPKVKEKPKIKTEKVVKVDKRKSKPDKKKLKEKEEKVKEDSTVPKMTLKLSGAAGSTKISVKPNIKKSASLSSSPSELDSEEESDASLPSAVHIPSPSPSREPTPPPRVLTPSPPPSPPPPMVKEETPPPVPLPPVTKSTHSRGRGRGRKPAVQAPIPPARTVITETLGTIVDESGNKIWICPTCSLADDGSPMIGCDECDDWYHWVCVGIVVPPREEEEWFCVRCIAKRQSPVVNKRGRKKHKRIK